MNHSGSGPTQPGARLSAWKSVGRFGLFVFGIGAVLTLLATPWLELSWWTVFRRCVSIAAALSLWLCIRKFEHRSFRSYGLSASGSWTRQLLFGLLLGFGTLGLMLAMGLASGICRIELTPDRIKLWRTVLGFLPAAGLVGVLEELVFRGFLLQHLMVCSTRRAVVVSSALYALLHLKAPTLTMATSLELGGLFLLGVILSLSYLRTRQLFLAIGLHAALAYGARVNKLLIQFSDMFPSWLVGTSRLVNGLMGWAALLGIGGLVLWWTRPAQKEA